MTKNFLVVACLSTVLLHGMEPIENGMATKIETISLLGTTNNSLSLIYQGTKIHLSKEPLSTAANKANCTIVGGHQQELLSEQSCYEKVGTIIGCPYTKFLYRMSDGVPVYGHDPHIYIKNNDDDSGSENDIYKPYPYGPEDKKEKLYDGVFTKITSNLNMITEPCINRSDEGFVYNVWRKNPNYHTSFMGYDRNGTGISIDWGQQRETILLKFTGDKAIQEASNDLAICYREILRIMAGYYSSADNPEAPYDRPFVKPNIDIVIPPLSVDVGFPRNVAAPIAIAAIFNFLQEYPEGYNNIYLVVKIRSEFALYKKLLMEYYKPIKAIRLLYLMHKDAVEPFS